MSKAASRDELKELHRAMADHFRKRLRNQDPDNPLSASELGVILKFLSDSGIKADESGANSIFDKDTRERLRQELKAQRQQDQDEGLTILSDG